MDPWTTENTTDILLFLAQTFFLPPANNQTLRKATVKTMNSGLDLKHLWIEFTHSLAALSTLSASGNNVFAIMLQVLPSNSPVEQIFNFKDIGKIETAQFICADNWDKGGKGPLGEYIAQCLEKILVASEKIEEGKESEFDAVVKNLINYVYKATWEKFCRRMTKTNNRGQYLVHFLEELLYVNQGTPKPVRLLELIRAVHAVLDIINSPPQDLQDYFPLHEACTRVRQEAFMVPETKNWLTGQAVLREWKSKGATPFRILQKMVKTRNAIETIVALLKNPEMQRTFQAARTANCAGQLITWVQRGPQSGGLANYPLNLAPTSPDALRIKKAYTDALSLVHGENNKYAKDVDVWKRISTNAKKTTLQLEREYTKSHTKFTINTTHKQHCEGKLLRHVIQSNLLGKVFPYIGCSKLCCEPCFTAITAVNELIQKSPIENPEKVYFAADGTHRKIYSNFGITPIEKEGFDTPILLKTFNKLLCRDIGILVKKGVEKGLGGSDSDP